MLLKIEKEILKRVSKNPTQESIDSCAFKKHQPSEIKEAFISLKEKNYFSEVDYSIDLSSFSYVLTPQGMFYKEYARKKFFSNIIIPIIVSLLTTIGTLYLENLVENYKSQNHSDYSCEYSCDDF